ncbi:DUF1310 family protein [uncultured Vagococcus sp.]|uniref:DUF1310 family protein n=1 Tax=uncultured Vagococcus sp. TaxID=189676 RepID=UPI0028D0B34E|nr:DUF1310 family protein [uncultured Vagococcus sp.]
MEKQHLKLELEKIVKSEKAQVILKESLQNIDSKAFKENGIIQTYEIDYDGIRHNPMGGVMVTIYINGKSELYVKNTLEMNDLTGELSGGGGGYSSRLDELISDNGG